MIAAAKGASQRVLRILSRDPDESVGAAVAGNPNCPSDALLMLAHDRSPYAAEKAVANEGIGEDVLLELENELLD